MIRWRMFAEGGRLVLRRVVDLAAEVRAERIAQQLPPVIEDTGFYRRFVDLIDTDVTASRT